jgi:hypothetical protein
MTRLDELVSDLRKILLPNPAVVQADKVDGFEDLKDLLNKQVDNADLDFLNPDELRALTTLRITVYRSATADVDTARKQIAATWRGMAKQAALKLTDGPQIAAAIKTFLDYKQPS